MTIRAYVEREWAGAHRLIVVKDKFGAGKVDVLSDFVWREHDEGFLFDPGGGIGQADELIQSILDKAWEAGFRPRGFADVKNETDALRGHLADMKAIAFHGLKIKT